MGQYQQRHTHSRGRTPGKRGCQSSKTSPHRASTPNRKRTHSAKPGVAKKARTPTSHRKQSRGKSYSRPRPSTHERSDNWLRIRHRTKSPKLHGALDTERAGSRLPAIFSRAKSYSPNRTAFKSFSKSPVASRRARSYSQVTSPGREQIHTLTDLTHMSGMIKSYMQARSLSRTQSLSRSRTPSRTRSHSRSRTPRRSRSHSHKRTQSQERSYIWKRNRSRARSRTRRGTPTQMRQSQSSNHSLERSHSPRKPPRRERSQVWSGTSSEENSYSRSRSTKKKDPSRSKTTKKKGHRRSKMSIPESENSQSRSPSTDTAHRRSRTPIKRRPRSRSRISSKENHHGHSRTHSRDRDLSQSRTSSKDREPTQGATPKSLHREPSPTKTKTSSQKTAGSKASSHSSTQLPKENQAQDDSFVNTATSKASPGERSSSSSSKLA